MTRSRPVTATASDGLLRRPEAQPDPAALDLLALGQDAYGRSALPEAQASLEAACEAARQEGNRAARVQALIGLGKVQRDLGEVQRALRHFDDALELAVDADEPSLQADALNQRAGAHHLNGEYARALQDLRQAQQIALRRGDERRAVNALINIGILCTKLGDHPRALDALLEAHHVARETLRDAQVDAQVSINLGLLYESMGDDARALGACERALHTLNGLELPALQCIATVNLGYAHQRLGEHPAATARFEQALTLARDTGQVKVEIAALDGLGQVRAAQGDVPAALAFHHTALRRARDTGDMEGEMDAQLNLGRAHLRAGAAPLALAPLHAALALAQHAGRQKSALDAHLLLSEAFEASGQPSQALAHYRDHHAVERRLFNEEGARRTRHLTVQFDLERAQHEAETHRLRTELERAAKEQAEATVLERTRELQEGHAIIERQRAELHVQVRRLEHLLTQNEGLRQRLMRAANRSATLNERALRRLSAELHDGPAQELGFALLKLDTLDLLLDAPALTDERRAAGQTEVQSLQAALGRALGEMRAIASGMCLPELDSLGLADTLRRVIQAHQRRTRTHVSLQLDQAPDDAPLPVKITLYRLAQEGLNNAYKHAAGTGQALHLRGEDHHVVLDVTDQGPGFQPHDAFEPSDRLGLLGMRERVESLGGTFELHTAPGHGTRLRVRLPLHPAPEVDVHA